MNKKTKLKNTADEFWRLCVIKKYGQFCEVCDDNGHDVHHFIPRSQSAILRHNIDNGVILCQSYHIGIHQRQDPTINNDIIKKRGKEWYEKIKEIYKNSKKQSLGIKYYEKVIEELEEYLQENPLIKTLAMIKKCSACGKTETEFVRGGSRIWVCENKDCSMKIDIKKMKNWKKV